MRKLQKLFFSMISLIIAAFTLIFILENNTNTATVNFLTYEISGYSVAIIIMLSLIAGMIIAMIISSFLLMSVRLRLAAARKQLNNYKKELSKQNAVPVLKAK